MSIFNLFKRKPAVPDIIHPVFSRICFQGDGVWECGKILFTPEDHEIEVLVYADSSGPTNDHLNFLTELSNRWPEIKTHCEPMIRKALVNWIEKPEGGDVWRRLKLESLDIYSSMPADREWEIMFYCEEAGHYVVVGMIAWSPVNIGFDG
jgi:hypothetical protein